MILQANGESNGDWPESRPVSSAQELLARAGLSDTDAHVLELEMFFEDTEIRLTARDLKSRRYIKAMLDFVQLHDEVHI